MSPAFITLGFIGLWRIDACFINPWFMGLWFNYLLLTNSRLTNR